MMVRGAFGSSGLQCLGVIEDMIKEEGGSLLVRYIGCNYLCKGFLDAKCQQSAYAGKRLLAGFPKLLSSKWLIFWMGSFGSLTYILPKKIRTKILILIFNYLIDAAYQPMGWYALAESAYNTPMQELHRATRVFIIKTFKNKQVIEILEKLVDIICMTFQFDLSYRFRYQDIFPLVNKVWLRENPRKELMRVLKIYLEREINFSNVRAKWDYLWNKIGIILWFVFLSKKRRQIVIDFFDEVDLEKIKMDEADWYYSLDRDDYNHGGLTYKEKMAVSKELDGKMQNNRPRMEQKGDKIIFFNTDPRSKANWEVG